MTLVALVGDKNSTDNRGNRLVPLDAVEIATADSLQSAERPLSFPCRAHKVRGSHSKFQCWQWLIIGRTIRFGVRDCRRRSRVKYPPIPHRHAVLHLEGPCLNFTLYPVALQWRE